MSGARAAPPVLYLTTLGSGSWCLCDSRFARSDPRSLIAYVELTAACRFDVVWIGAGGGGRTDSYASLQVLLDDAHRLVDQPRSIPGIRATMPADAR